MLKRILKLSPFLLMLILLFMVSVTGVRAGDDVYNTKVFLEQGGVRQIIKSGGWQVFRSGAYVEITDYYKIYDAAGNLMFTLTDNGTSGSIDATAIGTNTPANGAFTTLTITSMGGNWTNAGRTVADAGILTTVDINGGSVDGTTIGAASASTGAFSTLNSTGTTAIGNDSATVAINSSDWDISATGVATGIASVGFDSSSVIYFDTVEITDTEIKALRATKKQLVAAPGANKFLELVSAVLILDKGTSVYTESTDDLVIEYATSGQDATASIETTGFIDQAADQMAFVKPAGIATVTAANVVNNALQLFNTGDGEYGGGAETDGSITVKIAYRIHADGL